MEKPLTFDWLRHCPTHAAAEERLAGLEHFHLGGEAVLDEAVMRLGLPTRRTVIELGCGLGGVGRFLLRRNPGLNISGYETDGRSTTMESGAQCVMITLEYQRQPLLVDNLDFLQDTSTIILLVTDLPLHPAPPELGWINFPVPVLIQD